MKAAGIVAEFNPFHNGHAHILSKARNIAGASGGEKCAVVCVMSGNFVQRGDCAVMSKHARAESAVRCGADLVIELPLPWVLSSADIFAFGAVSLLDSLGVVSHLVFGSESGNARSLDALARALYSKDGDAVIAKHMKSGMAYASARQAAADTLAPDVSNLLLGANDLLGAEYIAALHELCSSITPSAVLRLGAQHDTDTAAGSFASATLLRSYALNGTNISPYMPAPALDILSREMNAGRAPATLDSLDTAILSRLRALKRTDFEALPGARYGLGLRLMDCVLEPTLDAIAQKCKSKRFALSRIRRLILCAALGINFGTGRTVPPYVRVLAANKIGASLLREISLFCPLPIITKPAHAKRLSGGARAIFELEAAATDLYSLACPNKDQRLGGEEWRKSPIIIKNDEMIK